jgi:ATP adenylyltransferase
MAMTSSTIALCPRLAEGAKIVSPDGHVLGNLALNGTVLAGTALVKSELEWEALQKDVDSFTNVLRGIGIPSDEIDEEKIKL